MGYIDSSGHLTEEQIMELYGVDTWIDVLALFQEGGLYAGKWGWLETLRQAEIGDKIIIEWQDGNMPEQYNGTNAVLSVTFDKNGKLVFEGKGFAVDPILAGQWGESYELFRYLEHSPRTPSQPRPIFVFKTPALHDPYLHAKVKWEELAPYNPEAIHVAKMAGGTIIIGTLTLTGIGIVTETCMTPVACFGGVALMGPVIATGVIATGGLARGTIEVFQALFIEITP